MDLLNQFDAARRAQPQDVGLARIEARLEQHLAELRTVLVRLGSLADRLERALAHGDG